MLRKFNKIFSMGGVGLFIAICSTFTPFYSGHAAEIVNVEYIVGYIKNKWDVDVPYEEEEIHWAANVEYLLKVVDYVNGKLNNGEKTNYGESEYATKEVVDTIAANQAIRTLIKKKKIEGGEFWFITDRERAEISVGGACGTFTVDWGDGTTDAIDNRDEENADNCEFYFYHSYEDGVEQHTVTLRGNATKYSEEWMNISFGEGARTLTEIGGCLGCIFHTQADGSQPSFGDTFDDARFTEIPAGFFDGIYGPGREYMFEGTFHDCENLKSIPEHLFDGIDTTGEYPRDMFYGTFSDCTSLTGPSARINGKYLYEIWPDVDFQYTYDGDYKLYDYFCHMPENWGGQGAIGADCTDGPIETVFSFVPDSTEHEYGVSIGAAGVFYIDWGDGSMDKIERKTAGEPSRYAHEYNRWQGDASNYTISMGGAATEYGEDVGAIKFDYVKNIDGCLGCIFGTLPDGSQPKFEYTFLSSWKLMEIPATLFSGIHGDAIDGMFYGTFAGTGITEIPDNLFAFLETGAENLFFETFARCYDLIKVGDILPKLTGPASYPDYMFQDTFFEDEVLRNTLRIGPAGKELWEMWPDVSEWQATYYGATQIPNYSSIPDEWK